ncbi:MAG: DUF2341 domain-containing protein [candidate division SR1 bacterium]|nr:DUF2341 domain-containing protein [candidate division SR1 bacterium]
MDTRLYTTIYRVLNIATFVIVLLFICNTNISSFSAGYITKTVTVTNSIGSIQANYPIDATFDTTTEIIAGRMKSNCGDIRVYGSDFATPLTFAFLNCNTTFTSVVFVIPSIPVGTSTYYITFGDNTLNTTATPLTVFDKYEMFTATPTCTLSGSAVWDSVNNWLQLTPSTAVTNAGYCNYAGYIPGVAPNRGYKVWFDTFTGTVGTATGGQAIWQYAFDNTPTPTTEDAAGLGGAHFNIDEFNARFCYNGAGAGCAGTATFATTNANIANGIWRSMKATYSQTTKELYENSTLRVSTTLGTAPTLTNTNFGFGGRTTASRAREHRMRNFALIKYNELVTLAISSNARPIDTISLTLRNSTDTANFTNLCDFGDLSIISVGSCQYRIKYSTTARNGYSIQVRTSGPLISESNNVANATAGTGGSGGTNIVANTEGYGVIITPGSCTNGTNVLATAFNPLPGNAVLFNYVSPTTVLSCDGPNIPANTDTTNTILVDQRAAISGNTLGGIYTQTVTWTVVPNY